MSPSGQQPTLQDLQSQIDGLRKLVSLRLLGSDPSAGMASSSNVPVQPTQIATADVQLTGVTWTNNSPGAGSVAWTAFQIVNQGNTYIISAGNTSNRFIWWTVGNPTLTTGAAYTPAVGVFLIATNTGGTLDETWQKVGLNSITDATINSLTANKLTAGTIDASIINVINLSAVSLAAGSIDATKLNIKDIIVVGLTISDNTPVAGSITLSNCTICYNGSAYAVTGGVVTDKYIAWIIGASTFITGATSNPVSFAFLIATNNGGISDIAWNKMASQGVTTSAIQDGGVTDVKINSLTANKLTAGTIDASVITVTNLNASNIASGTLNAGRISAASIDATKLNILQIIVVGMTLSDNTPGAGFITASNCTIYYNGTAYSVTGGNTNAKYIYWDVGAGSFTSGNTFAPLSTRFLIATNTNGTSDVAWSKLAKGGVGASQMNFPGLQNIPGIMFDQFTWTENSPGVGSLAWSAGQVTYKGATYSVSSGNANISHPWIYWQLSSPTIFQSATNPGAIPVLGADGFIVALNDNGQYGAVLSVPFISGARCILGAGGLYLFNSGGHLVGVLQRQIGTPDSGALSLADGTGSGGIDGLGTKVFLDGNAGVLQATASLLDHSVWTAANNALTFTGNALPTTSPGLAGKYITVSVNGTQYKLALYSV